ncbi:hypothetical protein MESS4_670011 [Mesorhizobium sp. STM 4661]|nr:hypothetical protein MESS4_670011 [Mesorhizobium sp. STM 4661]
MARRLGETVRNAPWPLDGIFAATYWNRVERREQRGLVAEWLRRGLQILAPRFDSGRGLQAPKLPRASARGQGSDRNEPPARQAG